MTRSKRELKEEAEALREDLVTRIKESYTKLESVISSKDTAAVNQLYTQVSGRWERIEKFSNDVMTNITDLEEKKKENLYQDDYHEKKNEIKAKAERYLMLDQESRNRQQSSSTVRPGVATNVVSQVKLPNLELATFDGKNPEDWLPWWDHFRVTIHEHPTLSKVQKFSYLVRFTKGSAAAVFRGYSLDGTMYDAAITALTDEFGRTDSLKAAHFAGLHNLTTVSDRKDVTGLRRLYDDVMGHIRSLESLGVSESAYADVLKPVLLLKVPEDVTLEWYRKKDHMSLTVSEFLKWFREELVAKEDAAMLRKCMGGIKQGKQQQIHQHNKETEQVTKGTATSLVAQATRSDQYKGKQSNHSSHGGGRSEPSASASSGPKYPCVFCNSNHYPVQCTVAVEKKWHMVKTQNRCHVCLQDNHMKADCRAPTACRKCSGRHHTALHSERKSSEKKPPEDSKAIIPSTSVPGQPAAKTALSIILCRAIQLSNSSSKGNIFLQTATIWIDGPRGSVRAFCLFDGGSQLTFIRREIALRLGLEVIGQEDIALQVFGSSAAAEPELRDKMDLAIRGSIPNAQLLCITAVDTESICPAPSYEPTEFAHGLHSKGYHLADSRLFTGVEPGQQVDILIGADYYWSIVGKDNINCEEGTTASPSKVGWLLHGPSKRVSEPKSNKNHVMFISSMQRSMVDEADWSEQQETPQTGFHSGPSTSSNTVTSLSTIVDATASNPAGSKPPTELEKSDMDSIWIWENMGISNMINDSEVKVSDPLADYSKTKIRRGPDGRMIAALPWKPNKDLLKPNELMCQGRLQSLLTRLRRSPELLATYHEKIMETVRQGFITEVDGTYDGAHTYLPHHPVVRPDKNTKVRPVFDASAKTRFSPSLNDVLHIGPNNTPDILAVLLRFRIPVIAWIGDIEKAFHQIQLEQEDALAIRFLWVEDPSNPHSPIKRYAWRVLPFGLVCSPFILRAVVDVLLDEFNQIYPETVQMIREQLYVDDGLGGARSLELASKTIKETKEIFASAKMVMQRWITNCEELQQSLIIHPITTSLDGSLGQQLTSDESPKVLGLSWDAKQDIFKYDPTTIIKAAEKLPAVPTKRQVSKISSKIFDPLGHLAPVTVIAKLIYQETWVEKIGWDEPVTQSIHERWKVFTTGLQNLSDIRIPRQVAAIIDKDTPTELHMFCDASEKAMAAVAYLRTTSSSGQVNVNMLVAKTKVAKLPLKSLTIPRLELMAAELASALVDYIRKALSSVKLNITMWSDSEIVLAWIKGDVERKTLVQNRINAIRKLTDPSWWRHCPGKDNPADLASRGMTPASLATSSRWWNGPEWLARSTTDWPAHTSLQSDESFIKNGVDVEIRKKKILHPIALVTAVSTGTNVPLTACETSISILNNFATKYSSFPKLIRISAWILRFIDRIKKRAALRRQQANVEVAVIQNPIIIPFLLIEDRERAENFWIAQVQKAANPIEYHNLSKEETINIKSNLVPLRPIWDAANRIIRVTGRIEPSMDAVGEVPPILLPYFSLKSGERGYGARHVIALIIKEAHRRTLHSGLRTTLSELRDRFWIVKGRQVVKTVLKECIICQKLSSRPFDAPAAPLPVERTVESRPFQVAGVDFAGPLYIRPRNEENQNQLEKVYVCLFTCAVTRAVHLEVVENLTTRHFLLAIRRFFAHRGTSSIIYSDNAKTYKLSAKYFKSLEKDGRLHEFLCGRRLQWRFSANLAPWWGGFWERMVRSMKDHLKKEIGRARLTLTELQTVLTEVALVINMRPLTYVADGSDGDPTPLTPFQLITGHRATLEGSYPPPPITTESSSHDALVNRELKRRRIIDVFWKRWRNEYLSDLRRFHAPGRVTRDIKIGELVLVHDANAKRMLWPVAVVTELIPGKDGRVRLVNLRTSSGLIINRPIQRLYPLEADEKRKEQPEEEQPPTLNPPPEAAGPTGPPIPAVEALHPDPVTPQQPAARKRGHPRRPQYVGTRQQSEVAEPRITRRGRVIKTPPRLRE